MSILEFCMQEVDTKPMPGGRSSDTYPPKFGRHFGRVYPDSARPYDIRKFIAEVLLRAQPEIRTWLKEKVCLDALREAHGMRMVAVLMGLQLLSKSFTCPLCPLRRKKWFFFGLISVIFRRVDLVSGIGMFHSYESVRNGWSVAEGWG